MDRDALATMPEAGPVPAAEAATGARKGSSFRALRSRPFRLYFGGQVVSVSGTFLQQTAIGWLVLERTGSPSDLGLGLAAAGEASVAALLAIGVAGGVVQIADSPARQALVSRLVPPDDLASARVALLVGSGAYVAAAMLAAFVHTPPHPDAALSDLAD